MPPVQPPLPVQAVRHAASEPDRPALVDAATGKRFSRRELAELSARLAAVLARRGIGRGDVVALAMPNVAWWPIVALGVWRAGAALASLNPSLGAEEMGRRLAVVRPRLGLVSASAAAAFEGGVAAAGVAAELVVHDEAGSATRLERLLVGGADPFAEPEVDGGDLAVIPFSSGIEGLPKGVRLTHGNIAAAARQVVTDAALDADSVALAGAPVCNAMGLVSPLCAALAAGATIVTLRAPKADRVLELVAEHRVTHATLPPTTVAEIAGTPGGERHDTSSLRHVVTGGDHVPAVRQLHAGKRLGCVVRQAYGMTEALVISSITSTATLPSDPATVGWLAAGTEARLVDPTDGGDAAPGRPGELWIRGPQVMDGYYDDPDATAATITAAGWLRTGDLVRIRADGQLLIEDRLKELIKVKGASIAPAELELVLREHRSVRDAAVVGRPDAKRGEVPVAWVVPEGSATAAELISFVGSRVAPHKRVHDVRIVGELPRSQSRRLMRLELRDRERELAAATRKR
jgi:acyl-CoA synthetase (AMP-forming)/AMP-acid ligase II